MNTVSFFRMNLTYRDHSKHQVEKYFTVQTLYLVASVNDMYKSITTEGFTSQAAHGVVLSTVASQQEGSNSKVISIINNE